MSQAKDEAVQVAMIGRVKGLRSGEGGGEPARTQGGALTEPTKPPKTVVEQQGVRIQWNTRDHGPAHLHVRGEGPFTRIGQNEKPLKNNPELSGTQQSVVKEHKNYPEYRG